jgi:hypothetical protein
VAVLAAGCGLLIACGPVHPVTVGRGGHDGPEVYEGPGHGHGPPPQAPAHGYRRKHQQAYHRHGGEVELIFDSGLGVYVVVGVSNHYYWNGAYLRIDGGAWSTCAYLDGAWKPYSERSLPAGLRAKHAKTKQGKGKGKSKGKGTAKQHP